MQPIKIFFSCAPDADRDKRFVLALEKHFADQTNYSEVKIWHVHKASPGSNVQQEILTNLNSSDIILSPAIQQAYYMPVMPTVESLVKTKQTDDIKLNRLKRKTDGIKGTRQTEDLKRSRTNTPRKTDIQAKQGSSVLADNAQYASPKEIQSIARAQRRNRAKMRAAPNTYQSKSTSLRNWLEGANKEYEFFNKGSRRKIFFISDDTD